VNCNYKDDEVEKLELSRQILLKIRLSGVDKQGCTMLYGKSQIHVL
jgi:hypothetical protein